MKQNWDNSSNGEEKVMVLTRGWFTFQFKNVEDVTWVLARNWSITSSSLLLKIWTLLFDANKEKLGELLVWVRLPTLPPLLWTKDVIKAIGGEIGELLEAYISFLSTRTRRVAKILVRLDLRDGLFKILKISFER